MNGVHFYVKREVQTAEITVESAAESSPVGYLGIPCFPGTEAYFALQINVACGKQSHIQISVQGTNRHIQFRMIGQDMIRRLSLLDQRCNDLVFLMQFPLCHVDAASGVPELFVVLSVCKTSVVGILMCNGAVVDLFGASVADIGSLIQAITAFFFEVLAGLIAGGARSAFDTAEDDLAAGIGLFTVITMNTEVLSIIKGAFVIPVGQAVSLDLLGNGGGIFTQETRDILKGSTFVQLVFNVDTVFEGKVFLITGYIFTHDVPPSTAVRRRYYFNMIV